MALKITSSEEHISGNVSTTYVHISEYRKKKDSDDIDVTIRAYTAKARRDAGIDNVSFPKSIVANIPLAMTMAEFAAVENTTAAVYVLLKTYLEALGKTVVDEL